MGNKGARLRVKKLIMLSMAPASLPLFGSCTTKITPRLSGAHSPGSARQPPPFLPRRPAGSDGEPRKAPTQPMVRHRISRRKLPAPPVVCVQFGKISRGLETPGGRRGEAAAGHKQIPARRSQMESGGSGGGALRGETQPGRPLASCLPKGTGA